MTRWIARASLLLLLLVLTAYPSLASDTPVRISLFDGKTLAGWDGDAGIWQVQDGAITAGSLERRFPHNDFLATRRSFENFDLRLKIKLMGTEGFVNSGVQLRSIRIPHDFEVCGYQADAGEGYWGTLCDESRRGTLVPHPMNEQAMKAAFHKDDWNDYRIRAEGARIQIWLNGVQAVDYAEPDPNIPRDGFIALQIHGNGKTVVQFKDILIQELPPTPGAPTWAKLGGYKPRRK